MQYNLFLAHLKFHYRYLVGDSERQALSSVLQNS